MVSFVEIVFRQDLEPVLINEIGFVTVESSLK